MDEETTLNFPSKSLKCQFWVNRCFKGSLKNVRGKVLRCDRSGPSLVYVCFCWLISQSLSATSVSFTCSLMGQRACRHISNIANCKWRWRDKTAGASQASFSGSKGQTSGCRTWTQTKRIQAAQPALITPSTTCNRLSPGRANSK